MVGCTTPGRIGELPVNEKDRKYLFLEVAAQIKLRVSATAQTYKVNPASRPEFDIIQGRMRMQSRDTAGGPRLRRAGPIDICTGAAHLYRERSQQVAAARAVAGLAGLL